jgi:photosystem I P700 chlorophyll a apoprotein A2
MTLLERFLEPLPGGLPHPAGLRPISSMNWGVYAENPDSPTHIFGTSEGAGTAILTFIGGFHPQTRSLWLTDIAHHHLAIGILFSVAGVVLSNTIDIKSRLNRTVPMTCVAKQKLRVPVDTTITSMHLDLAINLATLGVLTSLTAQHMYSLPAYAFISSSLLTQSALYIHHQYIAGFLMVGSFAHAAIFLVRDYHPSLESYSAITWLLRNKSAVISLLSWVSLFLGFHTLGLYVHNDTCVALGNPEKQILIEPLFAQYIQIASGKSAEAYGLEPFSREFRGGSVEQLEKYLATTQTGVIKPATNPLWLPGWLNGVNGSTGPNIFLTIGPGDFLVHHAISLGVHTTTLILLKGALDARSSEMIPDKVDLGFSFPCDGPGRGGTCDVSAWDSVYLAVFWELNTTGWTTFYWHWKHLTIWGGNPGSFNESSTYLMGWFRDYLWTNSTPVITGYTPNAMSSQSAWTWMFLFGHLIWATGFMFLISWRGYWQELIETIVWAHERTPIANLVSWSDKPVALSIVQARLVGLAHFATGYIATYAPFTTASNTAAMAQTQTFELREIISRSSLRVDSLSNLNVLV